MSSLRRAVEAHIKWCLDPFFANTKHQIVESMRLEDRNVNTVVVVGGAARPAFPELPTSEGNWNVPITVMLMSSIDDTTVDSHNEMSHTISNALARSDARHKSKVQGLVVYDVIQGSMGEENEGRKFITVHNYEVLVNYQPTPPLAN